MYTSTTYNKPLPIIAEWGRPPLAFGSFMSHLIPNRYETLSQRLSQMWWFSHSRR